MATMCREATKVTSNLLIGVVLSCAASTASAAPFAECVRKAATRYSVSEELVHGIIQVESGGRSEAMNMGHQQRTRSYDIGLMQINSSWLKKLKEFNIDELTLKDPCTNIMVGTWILANHMKETGYDWNGVGAYNASCRQLNKDECQKARSTYTWKVYRSIMKKKNQPIIPFVEKENQKEVASNIEVKKTRTIRSVSIYESDSESADPS